MKKVLDLSELSLRGKFDPDSADHLATETLLKLYNLLLKEPFDLQKKEPTQAYHQLKTYWNVLRDNYYNFDKKLRKEQGLENIMLGPPIPPNIKAMNLVYRD